MRHHLSRARVPVAGVFVGLCAMTLSAATDAAPAQAARGSVDPFAETKIQHVVIVYQENHTFDDMLAATCEQRSTPCDGYTGPVTFADGVTASNIVMPDIVPLVKHDPVSQGYGMTNQWDRIQGCRSAPYSCVSHVDPADIPNLATLANTYAVSDATFAAGDSASFGAHVTLGAGTYGGFLGWNPVKSRTGHKPGHGWGCPSFLDIKWGDPQKPRFVPSCVPDKKGKGPYRDSPVPYQTTIMERMEQAGLSWHIYQGKAVNKPEHTSLSLCTYFYWCLDKRFTLEYDSGFSDFLSDAQSGTLPNLSMIIPLFPVSQHNGMSMAEGDNYLGSIISALQEGPEWASTAVFITYDDCGCFYDHVSPPQGLGLRNPMVIASPWAKHTYTDSTRAVQPYSALAFVVHNFGLKPLSTEVSAAYDYADSFDFTRRSIQRVEMTRQPVSPESRRVVARLLPGVERDPT